MANLKVKTVIVAASTIPSIPIGNKQVICGIKYGDPYYLDYDEVVRLRIDNHPKFAIAWNYIERDSYVKYGMDVSGNLHVVNPNKIYFITSSREFQQYDGEQWNNVPVEAIIALLKLENLQPLKWQ